MKTKEQSQEAIVTDGTPAVPKMNRSKGKEKAPKNLSVSPEIDHDVAKEWSELAPA